MSHVSEELLSAVQELAPKLIILQLGGNDIRFPRGVGDESNAWMIATRLLSLAHKIWVRTGCVKVRIAQLVYRSRSTNGRIRTDEGMRFYNGMVDAVNENLRALTRSGQAIAAWRHVGLSDPERVLCADGTHFNARGMVKYYKSLRGAIVASLPK